MRSLISFVLLANILATRAQEFRKWEFSHPQMGTEFRVVVMASDSAVVSEAVHQSLSWLDSLNGQLSDYLPDSELSRVMRQSGSSRLIPVSEEFMVVLSQAWEIAHASGGAFDPTVGPLSQVWRRAFRHDEFPEFERVAEARQRVDYQSLVLVPDSQGIRLLKDNMHLDLGGIAKGYAAEIMVHQITQKGFPQVLVDAGGDIAMGYPPQGQPGWRVIPLWPDDELEPLYLANTAIATSGDHYRYLEWEGQRYSHILDPRSGYGISRERLVTVQTPSATQADALASLVSVMGGDAFPIAERIVGNRNLQIWLWENTPKGWILVEFSNN